MNKYLKVCLFISLFILAIPTFIQAQAEPEEVKATAKVAVVFSTGGLGDKSFNDAANEGLQRAITKYGADLTTATVEPATVDEIGTALQSYAADGTYDLILTVGFSSADGVTAAATAYPNQSFTLIDAGVNLSNVASIGFKEHEGSFLVGAMAAMVTETDQIAFLGGADIELINRFRTGYEQGARFIKPSIKIEAQYSPDAANPWGDITGGKSVASVFIERGADIIYAAAGGTGLGVFEAVNETNIAGGSDFAEKIYAIGVDSNQDYLYQGQILTSMIKRVDVAVETQIEAIIEGTWTNGSITLGLAEDGVGMSNMEYTSTEKNVVYKDGKTRYEYVQSLRTDIINGDIEVVPTVITDYKPPTSPGFEFFFVFLVAIPLILYRRKN